jgi:phenylalanyl-tRNA synthetase alpha chain
MSTPPQAIYDYFDQTQPGLYKHFDDMFPVVTCEANFDEILIPADHVSRSANDTYYVSSQQVLRCHTSAHQAELLRTKQPAFLVTGGCVVVGGVTACGAGQEGGCEASLET